MSKGKVKIKLNPAGVMELLKSREMQSILEERGKAIAEKSDGSVKTYVAGTRAVAKVKAENRDNTLLKAVR